MTKRLFLLLVSLFTAIHIQAYKEIQNTPTAPLSEDATISLLTSGPSDMAIFTAWGHSAIRVKDPATNTDIVFNYGIFSFGEPISFVMRFVSGQTDYRLGKTSMAHSIEETIDKNADYYEQVLNLTQREKESLYGALLENYKPENRIYRYKYFTDNCATRPRSLLQKCIEGELLKDTTDVYHNTFNNLFKNEDGSYKNYRNIIYELLPTSPWYRFGIDLCLGLPTDIEIKDWDQLFLPIVLKEEVALQYIQTAEGDRPLVTKTNKLLSKKKENESTEWTNVLTPTIAFWTLLFFTLLHVAFYSVTGKDDRWAYAAFYGLLGIFGTIIFYVSCLSVHEFVYPNYNLMWMNPLHIIIAILIYIKKSLKIKMLLMYTTGIGCILAITYFATSQFVNNMQQFNTANLPLILAQLSLTSSWIWKKREACKKL